MHICACIHVYTAVMWSSIKAQDMGVCSCRRVNTANKWCIRPNYGSRHEPITGRVLPSPWTVSAMCMVTYTGERQSIFVLICCGTAKVLLSVLATYNYLARGWHA